MVTLFKDLRRRCAVDDVSDAGTEGQQHQDVQRQHVPRYINIYVCVGRWGGGVYLNGVMVLYVLVSIENQKNVRGGSLSNYIVRVFDY